MTADSAVNVNRKALEAILADVEKTLTEVRQLKETVKT